MKIINSLLAKQQKQFANLLFDSFQVILINPNSTPAEIECMQIVFRRCGKFTFRQKKTIKLNMTLLIHFRKISG